MLSRIVEEQPQNIALVLPLNGKLGAIGHAIRDGFIAAHYQLTPASSLKIYDSTKGEIVDIITRAVSDGAELVIGPLDREKVTAINVKPIEYLSQIPENKIGESILLISLIYGNDSGISLDHYSLFAIIEALERVGKDYTNQFIFEYFVNNSL